MIELQKADYATILPLISDSKQKVLPFSIAQGINPGRIFVDQKESPTTVLIWTTVGYYFLFGDPDSANLSDISQTISETFVPASQATGETGFILIPSSDYWKPTITSILPGQEVIEIYRTPHTLDIQKFSLNYRHQTILPTGYVLQKLDNHLVEKIGVLASWVSIDDFLTNGVGFAIMKDDQLASYCYSVFSSDKVIEIDVHTDENFRGLGLATVVSSTLIHNCLGNGKKPNWECFWDNKPSLNLAKKLGFVALDDYPVFYWEEMTP